MRVSAVTLFAAAALAIGLSLTPASAAGLLGGVLDGSGGDLHSIAFIHVSFIDFVDPDAIDAGSSISNSATPIDSVFV